MQSSLLARKHDPENNTDIYYTCEDPEFSDTLKDNLKFFLNKIGWDEDVDCFSIVPVKGKRLLRKYGEDQQMPALGYTNYRNAPAFRFPVLCRTWKPQIGRPWEMGNRLVERGDILWKICNYAR